MDLNNLLNTPPYSLDKTNKQDLLNLFLNGLTRHHYDHCLPYHKMMDGIGYDYYKDYNYTDLPFLPVRLFKMLDLSSVEKEEIVKTMTSSGTSGQAVSRISTGKLLPTKPRFSQKSFLPSSENIVCQ